MTILLRKNKELDVTEGLSLPLSSVIFLKHLKTSSLPSLVFQLLAAIILAWILESPLYQHKMVVSQITKVQFSSVAQSCPTLCNPVDCSTPDFPVHHQLPELTQTQVHCVCDAIQPSHPLLPLLLLPSIFPSIRVFSNESALRIRWPKYWSFSFSMSPSSENSGLISFRIDWLDPLAVQVT